MFTEIEELPAAQKLCVRFARRRWPRVLNALAGTVNPNYRYLEALGASSTEKRRSRYSIACADLEL